MALNWDASKPKSRIYGKLMQRYMGQQVTLVGKCISVDASGKQLKLRCTDDEIILVLMSSPVTEHIDPNAFVEIGGIVENRNKLRGFTLFTYQSEKEFDSVLYNEMIEHMMRHGDTSFFVSDTEEHHSVENDIIHVGIPSMMQTASELNY